MIIAQENIDKFVSDIPYYANASDFCLGKTLEEASGIIRKIIIEKESGNVGMAE